MNKIEENLKEIKAKVAECAKRHKRRPEDILVLAVSKGQSDYKVVQAEDVGQCDFGENYFQEAKRKIYSPLYGHEGCSESHWHFIGNVQGNKAKGIARLFSWVHTVDREEIAKLLNNYRPSNLPQLNVCIQVNSSQERTKHGVNMNVALELSKYIVSNCPRLRLRGLMTIPEFTTSEELQRAAFKKLHALKEALIAKGFDLDTLSMGMSQDFCAAIAEGATIVRIGTAIFGERGQYA